jgi:hypothetical protein
VPNGRGSTRTLTIGRRFVQTALVLCAFVLTVLVSAVALYPSFRRQADRVGALSEENTRLWEENSRADSLAVELQHAQAAARKLMELYAPEQGDRGRND